MQAGTLWTRDFTLITTATTIGAAGGIAALQDAEDFLRLGASRLGTSRVVKAVKALETP